MVSIIVIFSMNIFFGNTIGLPYFFLSTGWFIFS